MTSVRNVESWFATASWKLENRSGSDAPRAQTNTNKRTPTTQQSTSTRTLPPLMGATCTENSEVLPDDMAKCVCPRSYVPLDQIRTANGVER